MALHTVQNSRTLSEKKETCFMQENPHFKNILYPYTMYIYIENNQDLNEKMSVRPFQQRNTKCTPIRPQTAKCNTCRCHFTVGLSVLVGLVHSNTCFCINISLTKQSYRTKTFELSAFLPYPQYMYLQLNLLFTVFIATFHTCTFEKYLSEISGQAQLRNWPFNLHIT